MKERHFPSVRLAAHARNILIALALLTPPALNADITFQVLQMTDGKNPDCAGPLPDHALHSYEAIVIPGAGEYLDPENGNTYLSTFETRRLDAAALLIAHDNYTGHIVLSDGAQNPKTDKYLTMHYLQNRIAALSNGKVHIPDSKFVIDQNSINTKTGMQELNRYAYKNVLIVDDAFHATRSELLACAAGAHASVVTVEQIFALYDGKRLPTILKQDRNPPMLLRHLKENLELLDVIYTRGTIETSIKKHTIDP